MDDRSRLSDDLRKTSEEAIFGSAAKQPRWFQEFQYFIVNGMVIRTH
jgi:hypothetical protein